MAAPAPIWSALAAPVWASGPAEVVAEPPTAPASDELAAAMDVVPIAAVARVVLLPAGNGAAAADEFAGLATGVAAATEVVAATGVV